MSSDRLQESRRTEPRLLAALKVFISAAGECSCSAASAQKQRGFAPELLSSARLRPKPTGFGREVTERDDEHGESL